MLGAYDSRGVLCKCKAPNCRYFFFQYMFKLTCSIHCVCSSPRPTPLPPSFFSSSFIIQINPITHKAMHTHAVTSHITSRGYLPSPWQLSPVSLAMWCRYCSGNRTSRSARGRLVSTPLPWTPFRLRTREL